MNYFDWLCMWAIPNGEKREDYRKLMLALYDFDFYWSVSHDENRAEDGIQLREIFENETGEYCDKVGECSLLEMFLALAVRCNDNFMYDPDDPKRADRWFWMMIENLDLDIYTDDSFNYSEVSDICEHFCSRNYSKTGHYCAFYYPENIRKLAGMELFYQLGHYLKWRFSENF